MNGFERRRQAKKNAIIAAAYDLFSKDGIEAVKMTDIARKASVSKVSIYNFFGSKEELARQVMYDFLDKNLLEFEQLLARELSFKEKLEMVYEKKIDALTQVNEGFYKTLSSPKMQEYLGTYYETKIMPLVMEFIEQGRREGYIDRGFSHEALIIYYECLKGLPSMSLDKRVRIDLIKLILYGFRGKQPGDVATQPLDSA
jgi:AcrR family transcriptional regulator